MGESIFCWRLQLRWQNDGHLSKGLGHTKFTLFGQNSRQLCHAFRIALKKITNCKPAAGLYGLVDRLTSKSWLGSMSKSPSRMRFSISIGTLNLTIHPLRIMSRDCINCCIFTPPQSSGHSSNRPSSSCQDLYRRQLGEWTSSGNGSLYLLSLMMTRNCVKYVLHGPFYKLVLGQGRGKSEWQVNN